MNTTEKVVESYFRLVRGCFTMSDLKVVKGNNRQIDLLALNRKTDEQFHVEVSVTHDTTWAPTPAVLAAEFDRKFMGVPPTRSGKGTDSSRGKTYRDQIDETYRLVGLNPKRLTRVWVCWTVKDAAGVESALEAYCERNSLRRGAIRILSFRDEVLPGLRKAVGTANYDDDVLRMLSLLQQMERQHKHAPSLATG